MFKKSLISNLKYNLYNIKNLYLKKVRISRFLVDCLHNRRHFCFVSLYLEAPLIMLFEPCLPILSAMFLGYVWKPKYWVPIVAVPASTFNFNAYRTKDNFENLSFTTSS